MPARPSHIPHNVERSALQKLRATQGLPLAQLHPAGLQTVVKMVAKGWIERKPDTCGATRYFITLAGEAALEAKIPGYKAKPD
jgi:hypothetical protein